MFCEECGSKQFTVLIADVKGSMELAEQLDPEQWKAGEFKPHVLAKLRMGPARIDR